MPWDVGAFTAGEGQVLERTRPGCRPCTGCRRDRNMVRPPGQPRGLCGTLSRGWLGPLPSHPVPERTDSRASALCTPTSPRQSSRRPNPRVCPRADGRVRVGSGAAPPRKRTTSWHLSRHRDPRERDHAGARSFQPRLRGQSRASGRRFSNLGRRSCFRKVVRPASREGGPSPRPCRL